MPRKTYKCDKCDRSFTMPAHLARHVQAAHGAGKKKRRKAKKKTRRAKKVKRRGRKRTGKKVGRPAGVTARFGLRSMALEELTELIEASRDEARRKIRELEASIG